MPLPPSTIRLDHAAEVTRTGDIWIFRGRTVADRAIRVATNAPVNHVGMAVVLDDLPPLMWHAELGKGLYDVWAGAHQRGVQLHDLRAAVDQWTGRYAQQAWLRQLSPEVDRAQEDALLRVIAQWDGTPFPSTARLTARWLRGRAGRLADPRRWPLPGRPGRLAPAPMDAREAYCAEVVAVTYEAMGLLDNGMPSSFYDPGLFWSGDELRLSRGFTLGDEIAVQT
ncbi:MAG: hypothetical protein IPK37_16355 [Austwickia sp.]|jgi:hypothetical protein|nr:MAG: hypothetical protein IPK37_16355 [Austwickia sp.]